MKLANWRQQVKALKADLYALYLASRDPRVPLAAKLVIGLTVAYALSPIDLIPDFIPVLGYLDDLLLLPLGLWLSIRLVPRDVWEACKRDAHERTDHMPPSRGAAVAVIAVWLLIALGIGFWMLNEWLE